MRTYKTLPKKYQSESGTISVKNGYAYTTRYNVYNARERRHEDKVVRITEDQYNKLRINASYWNAYLCDPTEENLQLQIASFIEFVEPYCVGLGYTD